MNDLQAKKLKENSKKHFDEAALRNDITGAFFTSALRRVNILPETISSIGKFSVISSGSKV